MSCLAFTIEVGDLTLLIGGDKFGCEWQADIFPTLCRAFSVCPMDIYIVIRCTLIPHALTANERILDRTVELFLIHQEVVVCTLVRSILRLLHYMVGDRCVVERHSPVLMIWILRILRVIIIEVRIGSIILDCRTCLIGRRIAFLRSLWNIYKQVLGLITVRNTDKTIIVEQWLIEESIVCSLLVATSQVTVTTREVDGCHARICFLRAVIGLGSKISKWVIVSHTHFLRAEVSWGTVNSVACFCIQ